MSQKIIAIDVMSGDFGASVIVPSAIKALNIFADINLLLVGDEAAITQQLAQVSEADLRRITIRPATEVVSMDEAPALALKNKKDSSMRVALNLVKEQQAHACVSAGNTGALMATSKYVLKTIKGIDRPAICSALPSKNGHTHMLDLGANVDNSAEQLMQFAVMGSVLAATVNDVARPSIGLLNIGSEAMKGNETIKKASQLIKQCDINYVGFVEGDDIYKGSTDVVVTDGFSGNISLKTGEGLASFVSQVIKDNFNGSILKKAVALLAYPILKSIKTTLDPRKYNGASLLGLNGIVVKSHGGADEVAFLNAIKIARMAIEGAVPQRINDEISHYLQKIRD